MTCRMVTAHPFDPWGSKIGGIENFIRLFLQHSPDGIEHHVIGVTENQNERPLRQWTNHVYKQTPIQFYPLQQIQEPNRRTWLPLFLQFPCLLRKQNFVFENSIFLYHRVEPLAFSNRLTNDYVLFLHSHPIEWIGAHSEVKWKYIPWAYRYLERIAFRKACQIFCVNQSTVEYVKQRNPKKDCRFIPTTYDETKFFPPTKEERTQLREQWAEQYNLSTNTIWVIFAGRLEHQKNPLLAVRTIAELLTKTKNIQLLIAGDGSLKSEILKTASELNLKNIIHFLGSLNSDQMAELYKAGDIFLVSSRFEGMPLSVLEALACGLPVVSTSVGEIPNLIQKHQNGEIAAAHSSYDLASALINVIHQTDEYSKQTCAKTVEVYKSDAAMKRLYFELERIHADAIPTQNSSS